MEKILVFSFSFIGDAVLSTAVIQPLRAHFQDVHIAFLVGPRAFNLFATESNIDAIVVYNNRGKHAGWEGRLQLIKTLRFHKYDIVVNLRDSFTRAMYRRDALGHAPWGGQPTRGDPIP